MMAGILHVQLINTGKYYVKLVRLIHSLIVYFQVHDMMDDIAEQQDVAKEISEAISNPGKFQNIIINRMKYSLVRYMNKLQYESYVFLLFHSRIWTRIRR